ncbi:MAG: phosphomannomutase [Pseudoruegeria sp.]
MTGLIIGLRYDIEAISNTRVKQKILLKGKDIAPKFGTSGLRGLVIELTDSLIADYVTAFVATCDMGTAVCVGWDLRRSSPQIARTIITTIRSHGLTAIECGEVPTPALALTSMKEGAAAIMITGSHIPADRNGLKFYLPDGEISKADENRILAALGQSAQMAETPGAHKVVTDCLAQYQQRYVTAFGTMALAGLRLGIYEHSSVARDVLADIVTAMGADALRLDRSDTFIPVDTEAVDPAMQSQLKAWTSEHRLDAILSTDGDGDRPMLVNETGALVLGDVLGPLTAEFIQAKALCTPVSSNSMVDQMDGFTQIARTRIGSPFVIAEMEAQLTKDAKIAVVGYEANGGFLLGFTAQGPAGPLAPLMTRDSVLPMLAPLVLTVQKQKKLSELTADLPDRFTAANRITDIEPTVSGPFLQQLITNTAARSAFFPDLGQHHQIDTTDGLRITFATGDIVHLRPSGNAPEFRCYAESDTTAKASALVTLYLAKIQALLIQPASQN